MLIRLIRSSPTTMYSSKIDSTPLCVQHLATDTKEYTRLLLNKFYIQLQMVS